MRNLKGYVREVQTERPWVRIEIKENELAPNQEHLKVHWLLRGDVRYEGVKVGDPVELRYQPTVNGARWFAYKPER